MRGRNSGHVRRSRDHSWLIAIALPSSSPIKKTGFPGGPKTPIAVSILLSTAETAMSRIAPLMIETITQRRPSRIRQSKVGNAVAIGIGDRRQMEFR